MDADHVTAWSKGGGTMFIDILAPEEQAKKGEGIPVDTDHVAETKSWIVSGIYAFNRNRYIVSQNGVFSSWSVRLQLNYRF